MHGHAPLPLEQLTSTATDDMSADARPAADPADAFGRRNAPPASHPEVAADHGSITLDGEAIASRKADKQRRYTTRQVPALRLLGFTILWLIVAASVVSTAGAWPGLRALGVTFLIYGLGSWAALRLVPHRWTGPASLVFLGLDPFIWMTAVYMTGGEASWLYILPLMRVSDQLNTSRRQALAFTAIGVAAYVGMLGYRQVVDGQALVWTSQAGRIAFLVGCGGYLSMTAGTAERLRQQLANAVRTARASIRRLQEQSVDLHDARERAESASRAKSQFLASVSHEFRTPLNAIIGYTELLHEEMTSVGPQVHEDLALINRSAQHLRGLINDVIELSRLEVGRSALDVHPFAAASVVADALSVVMPLVRANRNVLEVSGAEAAGTLTADPQKVRQILVNLVGNAAKFTSHGRVTVRCSRTDCAGEPHVEFTVTDTGIGMTPEQLARIRRFEPFVQADGGIARQFGGTGLGLTISQRLAKLMGGSLALDSDAGRGCTATFRLPIAPPEGGWPGETQTERAVQPGAGVGRETAVA